MRHWTICWLDLGRAWSLNWHHLASIAREACYREARSAYHISWSRKRGFWWEEESKLCACLMGHKQAYRWQKLLTCSLAPNHYKKATVRKNEFHRTIHAVFVDEAHRVLQWGHGDSPFRGAYASFGDIQSFVSRGTPMIPMIAKAIVPKICENYCLWTFAMYIHRVWP